MGRIYLRPCEFAFNAEIKAMINVRAKGQRAEREICDMLNSVAIKVRCELRLPDLEKIDHPFQRNQNQSAIGGSDITNPFGLEVEVKSCAQLSLNTWWNQTLDSAARTGGMPILVYKIKHKGWRVRLFAEAEGITVVAEISIEDFLCVADKIAVEHYEDKEPVTWG